MKIFFLFFVSFFAFTRCSDINIKGSSSATKDPLFSRIANTTKLPKFIESGFDKNISNPKKRNRESLVSFSSDLFPNSNLESIPCSSKILNTFNSSDNSSISMSSSINFLAAENTSHQNSNIMSTSISKCSSQITNLCDNSIVQPQIFDNLMNSFFTSATSSDININSSSSATEDPLFSRIAYLSQFDSSGYIVSILNCLYTVPVIQKAFYDETMCLIENTTSLTPEKLNSSLAAAFSAVFVMLRTSNKGTSRMNKPFLDALKLHINWEERKDFEATTFWTLLSQQFPPSIKSLFDIKVKIDWISPDSKEVLFSEIQNLTSIKIPVTKPGSSTAELANVNFYDEKYFETVKDFSDPNSLYSLAIPRITFLNIPEILVFKIERNIFDPFYGYSYKNSYILHLSDEIEINGMKYVLSGKIVVDNSKKNHFADVLDFGNGQFYRHRITTVFQLNQFSEPHFGDKYLGKYVILLFYTIKRDITYDLNFFRNFQDIPNYIMNNYKTFGKSKTQNNTRNLYNTTKLPKFIESGSDKNISNPKKSKRKSSKKIIGNFRSDLFSNSNLESIAEVSTIFNTFNGSSSSINSLITKNIGLQDSNLLPKFTSESTCEITNAYDDSDAHNQNLEFLIDDSKHLDNYSSDSEISEILNTFNSNSYGLMDTNSSHQDAIIMPTLESKNVMPTFTSQSTCEVTNVYDDSNAQTQTQNSNAQVEVEIDDFWDDFDDVLLDDLDLDLDLNF